MEDKIIIKHYYKDKGLTPYKIRKDSLEYIDRKWDKSTVKRLRNRIDKFGSIERRPGSGRPRTSTTDENQEVVEELIL